MGNRNDSIHASGSGKINGAPAEDLEEGEVEAETEDELAVCPVRLSFIFGSVEQLLPYCDRNCPHPIQVTSRAQSSHVTHSDERNATNQPSAVSDMPQMGFSSGQASAQGSSG